MTKKILAVVSVILLLGGVSVSAASINYCENCGAALVTNATFESHWNTTHYKSTNLVDSNYRPIYELCRVSHDVYKLQKYCPNGHGVKWSAHEHREDHSCCDDKIYIE